MGTDIVSASEWEQATLPIRLGGLGIKDASQVRPSARVAACVTFMMKAASVGCPDEWVTLPPDFVRAAEALAVQVGPNVEPLKSWVSGDLRPVAGGQLTREESSQKH